MVSRYKNAQVAVVTMGISTNFEKKTIFIVKMWENVPDEIREKGKELRGNLLPTKSKIAYEKVYFLFQEWKNKKGITEVTEDVILAFLDMRVSVLKIH